MNEKPTPDTFTYATWTFFDLLTANDRPAEMPKLGAKTLSTFRDPQSSQFFSQFFFQFSDAENNARPTPKLMGKTTIRIKNGMNEKPTPDTFTYATRTFLVS